MLPAHERLHAGDPSRAHGDHRLVQDAELLALDRETEVRLELEQRHGVRVHLLVEHLVARLAVRLRAVHREVRVAEQVVGHVVARGRQRDADAGAHEDVLSLQIERALELDHDALGDARRIVHGRRVVDQHRELVAAEPGDRVARADALLEPPRHRHEQLIADGVAERVVHDLEAVEVEEEHGERVLLVEPRAADRAAQQLA